MTSSGKSLSDWLDYLESIHPSAIDMGLERVQQVAASLSLSLDNSTVITVAGTNGKGTTCKLLEAVLLSQGKSVGVYASPHLLDYRERVRINGSLPEAQAFCDAFEAIDAARGETTLTYFEFGTLAALLMFKQAQPEVVLLEVGLGGRLDATNIVDPDVAVITTIDLDHQAWLGDTRDKIAIEKAGIMREHGLAVIGELAPPASLKGCVDALEVNASWAGTDFSQEEHSDGWSWRCKDMQLDDLPKPQIPVQNASTALAVLHTLGWLDDDDKLRKTIAQTALTGRCQRLSRDPDVVVDVAHNPQATRALRQWLDAQDSASLHIVVGMLNDKAASESLRPLADLNANWYAAGTAGPRGMSGEKMSDALSAEGVTKVRTFNTVVDAYHDARANSNETDRILVFGSFLTVADVLALHIDNNGVVK